MVRPAHCIESNVSGANRQELFAGRIHFEERRYCAGQDSFSAKSLQNDESERFDHCFDFTDEKDLACALSLSQNAVVSAKALTKLKTIAVVITATFLFGSCSWFGPAEQYKTESGRTTYRAAEENPATSSEVTPASQKIPGESKKASSNQL